MKPIHTAKPTIIFPPLETVIRKAHNTFAGQIKSDPIDVSSWDPSPLFDVLKEHNYQRRKCRYYNSLSLTYINGACRWHTDPGFGVVACWLVHCENDCGYNAQLITKHGALEMFENSLCIFDSNKGHAWISNAICVMVMATITRFKRV